VFVKSTTLHGVGSEHTPVLRNKFKSHWSRIGHPLGIGSDSHDSLGLSELARTPDRHTLTVEQLGNLIEACETSVQSLFVLLLADTGLRRSELASVQTNNIDLADKTIRVIGKGRKRRLVRFGETTKCHLEEWINTGSGDERLLGLSAAGISSLLVVMGKKSGIICNAHSFRRLFACEAIRNGMNLFHVQSLLGHSTLDMTRLYAVQINSEDALKHYKAIVQEGMQIA
jgi:integrase/recombinase XerC